MRSRELEQHLKKIVRKEINKIYKNKKNCRVRRDLSVDRFFKDGTYTCQYIDLRVF